MSRKYFGTDGVRGTVGHGAMTPEFVMKLGFAAGTVLASGGAERGAATGGSAGHAPIAHPTVLIGKDTRISGYMLEAALEAGFSAAGVDVLMCGPLPTPGVAYLTRALRLAAGVVISASHNPFADNGIKFFSGDGFKLPDAVEAEIEQAIERGMGCVESTRLGRARRVEDAQGRYIEFCKSTVPSSLNLKGLKLVVDCAHGAAYSVAPHVFHELGAEVVAIGNAPDGFNINDRVGATAPKALQAAVGEHRADLGIALDGDADRLLIVDAAGRLYDGDELLYVLVKHRRQKELVAGVVGTLMTNFALEQAFARMGVAFARANVGDRYVLEMLRDKGWLFGGENSGHLLCMDKHTTGDGIVSALQVLCALRESGRSLGEFVSDLVMYPQILLNVRVPRGFDWTTHGAIATASREAERGLNGRGRVLLRASGTEPVLRVMVEGEPRQAIEQAANSIADVVRRAAA